MLLSCAILCCAESMAAAVPGELLPCWSSLSAAAPAGDAESIDCILAIMACKRSASAAGGGSSAAASAFAAGAL